MIGDIFDYLLGWVAGISAAILKPISAGTVRVIYLMAEAFSFNNDEIDLLLVDVVKDNQDKVIGWIKSEPGSWGFLAGQAVITVRGHAGRDLADNERRLVWSRMWWLLEVVKARIGGGP